MNESNSKEDLLKEPRDPLGFLILPIFGILLVAVVLLWLNQKEEEEDKKFFPVTGKITLNGKPLSGHFRVDFYPVEGSMNPVASSWVSPDGSFDLYSGQMGHYGAMPGEYRVVVNMMEAGEMVSWRIEYARNVGVEIDPTDGGTLTPPDPDPPFDIRYRDFRTTPQRAVIGETDNVINFDLPLFKEPKSRKKGEDKKQATIDPNKKSSGKDSANKDGNKKSTGGQSAGNNVENSIQTKKNGGPASPIAQQDKAKPSADSEKKTNAADELNKS